jgi:hypothetical protein
MAIYFRPLLILFFYVALSSNCFSQLKKIDAIFDTISKLQGGQKFDYIAKNLTVINDYYVDTILYFGNQAYNYGNEVKIPHYEGISKYLLANYYALKGYLHKALKETDRAYLIFKENKDYVNLMRIHNERGIIYQYLEENEKAVIEYEKGISYIPKTGNNLEALNLHINLSTVYSQINKKLAVKLLLDFLNKADSINGCGKATVYLSLASKIQNEDSSKCKGYLKLAEKFILESDCKSLLPTLYIIYVGSYAIEKDFKGAEEYARKAIEYGELYTQEPDQILRDFYYLAVILRWQDKFAEAEEVISAAFELMDKSRQFSWREVFIHESAKLAQYRYDFQRGFALLEDFIRIKDSTMQAMNQTRISDIRVKYETNEKELENEALRKNKEIYELKASRNYLGFSFLVTGAVVLIIFLWQRRKKEKVIAEQKQHILNLKIDEEKLKQEKLANELLFKNQQLATKTLQLSEKSEFINTLENEVSKLKPLSKDELKESLAKVNSLIKSNNSIEKDWEEFRAYFEQVNPQFFRVLETHGGQLTQSEIRLAALLKLRLGTKDCANILHIAPESVKTAKHRLKKKIGLEPEKSLDDFLASLS